ncbi:tetratricopeptide repeat protein [Psychrobacter lutiphocae]|uniref:tetratricopeptide repeat protein n=1 Tax=Psychrobacter lutiphocae TaxID=540500 RepID=UPI00037DE6BA|nr:hypothetical protein [Psychrobacter lutiphocae]
MKLVHMGQNQWQLEDSVISFPSGKRGKAPQNPQDAFTKKIHEIIEAQLKKGRDIDEVMQQVMEDYQHEILADIESQPPSAFEVIIETLHSYGIDAATVVAQGYVLEGLSVPENHYNMAFLYEQCDESFNALMSSRECMRLYLKSFPTNFNWKKNTIPWEFLDNRPFLRALFQLANLYANNLCFEEARKEGERLLSICPNDNLGVREVLVEWYMYTEDYQKIIKVCEHFPDDVFANIAFGKALAYCYLGDLQKADQAWEQGKEVLPKVAHEILKKRHAMPRGMNHDSSYGTVVNSKEQAYFYWQDMGEWWEDNETAQMLIEKKRAERSKK